MTPRRHRSTDPELGQILALLQRCFAYMEGRIDPPSSLHALTVAGIAQTCDTAEVWSLGPPPQACVFLAEKPGRLYLGKLAIEPCLRGQGHAHVLIALAEARAKAKGLPLLELQTRIELVENHAAFARMGFVKTAEDAHEGYDRPTGIVMQKRL